MTLYNAFTADAMQANLGFVVSQTAHIETGVYRIQRPEIQYPGLIPVDTTAGEWATTVTYYAQDAVGTAAWQSGTARDMPVVGLTREQHNTTVQMASIGYAYTLSEVQTAMMTGVALTSEKASAAVRISEEFIDNVALRGDPSVGFDYGLINATNVTRVDAAADGTGSSRLWTAKTADQIARDINDALSGIHVATKTVEMADTVLLPVAQYNLLATKRLGDTTTSLMTWIGESNVYTMQTGRPLTFRAVRGLETAGSGSTARMVAYHRDPEVLKLHIPMAHRFLPVWQNGPMEYTIPGIMRLGGLDIRRPGAMRYVDGI